MKRGTFLSTLILLGVIAIGCRGSDDLPTPPAALNTCVVGASNE